MKKTVLTLVIAGMALSASAEISIDDVVSNSFRGNSASSFTPMADGEHYLISTDKCIIRYSFRTGDAIDTLFNVETVRGARLTGIDGYILSPKEDRILIQSGHNRIFRNSSGMTLCI
mgnify:CR=1 FL=1